MNRLTLDPVGLESGAFTVMLDGDPVCTLDLDGYPPEIPADLQAEYDALCDSVEAARETAREAEEAQSEIARLEAIDEQVAEYPGGARQVYGGFVWVVNGNEQTWSKRRTQSECHEAVYNVVKRIGIADAFDLPTPAQRVQALLDGWHRGIVAAHLSADEFADEFFSVEAFEDDISVDLIYKMARAHWQDCRAD